MVSTDVAKKILADVKAVLDEASFKLDDAASSEMSLNDICHDILAHYMGSQPSVGDIQKLGSAIMNCLIDDFGVPFSKF